MLIILLSAVLISFSKSEFEFDSETLDLGDSIQVDMLQILTLKKPDDCTKTSKLGDKLFVKYAAFLLETGNQLANIYESQEPYNFRIGEGKVLKGWDQGLLGMCKGERRKLFIPSELGFGEQGIDDLIPPNASLMYIVDLIDIKDKPKSGRMDAMERAVNKAHSEGRKEFKRMATGELMNDGGRYIRNATQNFPNQRQDYMLNNPAMLMQRLIESNNDELGKILQEIAGQCAGSQETCEMLAREGLIPKIVEIHNRKESNFELKFMCQNVLSAMKKGNN
ncbi:MAG: putative FK506-binding protein 2 precursor [Streblomastix strix]|uniref:peptidylprolyl isomerase n=1 Tax=Streblomastix strix TaxID=222440 RepID=A0A5J4X1G2_9EUKA|nr:MAG: putative FK506-binding protein 2 precursor [Streblomastix strix]